MSVDLANHTSTISVLLNAPTSSLLLGFRKLHLTSQVLEFGRASYSCSVTYQTALDLRAAHLDVRSSSEACTMLDIILQSVALCRYAEYHIVVVNFLS